MIKRLNDMTSRASERNFEIMSGALEVEGVVSGNVLGGVVIVSRL